MMNAFTCGILSDLNFMSSRDLGRFVDHIGSAMFIGLNILFISVYRNIGQKSYRCNTKKCVSSTTVL